MASLIHKWAISSMFHSYLEFPEGFFSQWPVVPGIRTRTFLAQAAGSSPAEASFFWRKKQLPRVAPLSIACVHIFKNAFDMYNDI